jgi:mono/diheme cytochrome c family protein
MNRKHFIERMRKVGLVGIRLLCTLGTIAIPLHAGKAEPPKVVRTSKPKPMLKVAQMLKWDADSKRLEAKPNEEEIGFEFHFQNISSEPVSILRTSTSCGCTVAKLPKLPWKIQPTVRGTIPIVINLRGKTGTLTKTTTVVTDRGQLRLETQVVILKRNRVRSDEERAANIRTSAADRQAVFKNHCADCHVKSGEGKKGRQLYDAVCGICHDAENRAAFVPDLRPLARGKNREYWRQWIVDSKPATMMPAFHKRHDGPLDDSQVKSLVEYLVRVFVREAKTRNTARKNTKLKTK